MVSGAYPVGCSADCSSTEPLCFWLPRLLPPVAPLSSAQRREVCEQIMLRQDEAWGALIRASH